MLSPPRIHTNISILFLLCGLCLSSHAQVREVEEITRAPGTFTPNGGVRVENGILVIPIHWWVREGRTAASRYEGIRYFDGSSLSETPPPLPDVPYPPLFPATEARMVREQDARATLFPDINDRTSFIHLGFLYGAGRGGPGDISLERFDGNSLWEVARGDRFASAGRGILYTVGASLYWTDGLGDGGRLIHTFEPLTILRYEESVAADTTQAFPEAIYTAVPQEEEPQIDLGGVLGETLYVFTYATHGNPLGYGPHTTTVSKAYAISTLGWFTGPQEGKWALAENPGRDGQWDALTDVGRHGRAQGTDMVNIREDWYYAKDGSYHYFGQYPYIYEQGRDTWSYVITREEGLYRYDYREGRWLYHPADGSAPAGL